MRAQSTPCQKEIQKKISSEDSEGVQYRGKQASTVVPLGIPQCNN